MTIKFEIDLIKFCTRLSQLEVNNGSLNGWGSCIKTDNQGLINFFNEFLDIGLNGEAFEVGAYSDEVADYWDVDSTGGQLKTKFEEIIEEAINNTGMYAGFNNEF